MITEDYVSLEVAKLLKEKGFDADITTYRDDFIQHGNIVIPLQECLSKDKIKTPTLQMAMKWLREVKDIYIDVTSRFSFNADKDVCFSYSIKQLVDKYKSNSIANEDGEWLTYEETCETAIKYCLEKLA